MAIKFEEKGGTGPDPKKPAAKPMPRPAAEPEGEASETALPFAKPVRAEKKGRKPKS